MDGPPTRTTRTRRIGGRPAAGPSTRGRVATHGRSAGYWSAIRNRLGRLRRGPLAPG
jgi:hypothetical protein